MKLLDWVLLNPLDSCRISLTVGTILIIAIGISIRKFCKRYNCRENKFISINVWLSLHGCEYLVLSTILLVEITHIICDIYDLYSLKWDVSLFLIQISFSLGKLPK